ncbi:MAG: ATP-binding protein [Lachnospiraceae bacterium]|nr:ATP-binding protein [Lachnospiraceae bacterium]
MKKQNIINLIRFHAEKNDDAFASEVAEIAKDFERLGDKAMSEYLMELVSSASYYVPQNTYTNLRFLEKVEYSNKQLLLPDDIEENVLGITRAINSRSELTKFLFYGAPGTGKTESAYQIARVLNRNILRVDFEQLIDSRLGETAKNVVALFDEINHLPYSKSLVLMDEVDALVMDRVNSNDLREMGRVTSTFLKELDRLSENVVVIATTNLISNFDKAIIRRFDAVISFDKYSKEDLIEIADGMLTNELRKDAHSKQDIRLFNKILRNQKRLPYPGELKQIIKTAVAFSNASNEYDYLRKIYITFNEGEELDIQKLSEEGYTTREIEILSHIPKSTVSRKLKEID